MVNYDSSAWKEYLDQLDKVSSLGGRGAVVPRKFDRIKTTRKSEDQKETVTP